MYRADGRPWWEVPTGYPHTSDSAARPTNTHAEREESSIDAAVSNLLCLSASAFHGGATEHAALFQGYLSTLSTTSPIVPTPSAITPPNADMIASLVVGDYTPLGLRRVGGLLSASAQIWKELPDNGPQQQDTTRNVVVGLVDAALQKQQMVIALLLLKASGITPKQYLSHTKGPKALQLLMEGAVSTITSLAASSSSSVCPPSVMDVASLLEVGWVLQSCAALLLDTVKTSIDVFSNKVIPSLVSIPADSVLRKVVAALITTIWIPQVQDALLAAANATDPSTTGVPSYVKIWTLMYTLTKTANTLDGSTAVANEEDHTLQVVRRSMMSNKKASRVQLHEARNILEFETPSEGAKSISVAEEGRIAVNRLVRLSVPNLLDSAAGSTEGVVPNVSTAVFIKEYAVDEKADNAKSRQIQLNGLLHALLVSEPVDAWAMILDRSVTLPCLSTARATTSTSDMADFDQFTGDTDTRTSSRFRCFYETITGVFSATPGGSYKPCGNAALTATTNDPAIIIVNSLLFYFNMVEQVLSATLGAVLTSAILGKESPSSSSYTPHQKEQAEAIRTLIIASLDEALLSLHNTRFSGSLVGALVTVYGLRTAPGAPMKGIPHSALLSLWANLGSEVPAAHRVREVSEGGLTSPRYTSLREEWNYAISRSCSAISQSHQWSHTILPLTLLSALGCHGAATTSVSSNQAFFAILNAGSSDVAARAALASAMPLPLFSRFTAAADAPLSSSTSTTTTTAISVAHTLSQDAVSLLRMPLTGRTTPDLLTALLDAASEAAVLVSLYRSNLLPQAYLKDTNPAMIDSACALFYAFLSLLRCQGMQVTGGQSAAESRLGLLRRMECAVEMVLAEVGTRFGVPKSRWMIRIPTTDAVGTDAQSTCPFLFWGLLSATEYALLAELRTERHSSMRAEEDSTSDSTAPAAVGLKRQSTSNASLRVQLQPSETLVKHMNASYTWMVMRSIHTLSATSPSHLGSIATKATSALPAHALVQLWRFNESFTPLDTATWASLATKGADLDTLVKGRCKDLPGDFVTETANIVQSFAASQVDATATRSLDAQADIEAFYRSPTTKDSPSTGINLLWTSINKIRAPSPITPTEELISAEHHFADVRTSSQYAAIASLFQCILSKALLCPREALFASVLLHNLLKGIATTPATSTDTSADVEVEGDASKAADEAAPSTLLGALANKYAEDGEGEEEEDQEDDAEEEEANKDGSTAAEEAPATPKAAVPKPPTYPLHFVTLCALRDVFLVSGLRQLYSGTKRDAQCLSVFFELLVNKVLIPWCEGGTALVPTSTSTVFTTPRDAIFPALPAAGTDTSMECLRMLIANLVKGYEIALSEPHKVSCCGLTAALFVKRRLGFVMGWLRRHRNYVLWAEVQMGKNIARISCGLSHTYAENTYLSCKGIELGIPPKVPVTPTAVPPASKPAVINKLTRAVSAVVATNAAAGVAPISNEGAESLSEVYPKLTAVLGIPLSPPLTVTIAATGGVAPRRRSNSPDQSRRPPVDSSREADKPRDTGRRPSPPRRGASPRGGAGDKRPRSPVRDDRRDERPPRRDDPRDDRRDADRRGEDRRADERRADVRRGEDRRDDRRGDDRRGDGGRDDRRADNWRADDRQVDDRRGRDDRRDTDRRDGGRRDNSPRRGDDGRDDRRPAADKPSNRGGRDDRRGGGGRR